MKKSEKQCIKSSLALLVILRSFAGAQDDTQGCRKNTSWNYQGLCKKVGQLVATYCIRRKWVNKSNFCISYCDVCNTPLQGKIPFYTTPTYSTCKHVIPDAIAVTLDSDRGRGPPLIK